MTSTSSRVNMRAITHGPRCHWFGYYDKLQFDRSGRYALGMAVDFEHRSPRPDDVVEIGMVDLAQGDRWIGLGESRAWGWQQGCMLQWRPGSASEVVWNDRVGGEEGGRFAARILELNTGIARSLPQPIYTIAPDGRIAVTPDFRRINDMRPGYGYAELADPYRGELAPASAGIHRIDLETGYHELIVALADIAALPYPHGDISTAKHYFNHLLFNPDGSRFVFLHRWRFGDGPFYTRMCTAAPDGSDVRVVDDSGHTSHFIWRDPDNILAWSHHPSHGAKFYLFHDSSQHGPNRAKVVGPEVMAVNGHCTYLPGHDGWIVNDTYPDADRMQELYLYDTNTGCKVELGRFYAPADYDGEWRCDLHPRADCTGRRLCVDSAHAGHGRQMYVLDLPDLDG